jgi:hypothetical protein
MMSLSELRLTNFLTDEDYPIQTCIHVFIFCKGRLMRQFEYLELKKFYCTELGTMAFPIFIWSARRSFQEDNRIAYRLKSNCSKQMM